MHEMAHVWLLQLEQIAAIAPADSRAAKDYNTIMEWAAWRPGQVNEFTDTATAPEFVKLDQKIRAAVKSGKLTEAESLKKRWAQERFARGFEDYLRTGEAPSVGLRKIFRQFKKWLTNLYRGYTSVGAPVSDDVKAIMDRMLATEEEIEMAAAEQSAVANVNGFPFTITGSTARIVCTTPC